MRPRLIVITGAGISQESGINTFRDTGGLWEKHPVEEVATPQAFAQNPELVYQFYNQRRRDIKNVQPNAAHLELAKLEQWFDVHIITQNIDPLHELAGSSNVLHLHGEIFKVRSLKNPNLILQWEEDLNAQDRGPDGAPLRPHIVWFGEAVPAMEQAIPLAESADACMVVGTSLQVYPAAGLVHYLQPKTPGYYIDTNPANVHLPYFTIIAEKASTGVLKAAGMLKSRFGFE